MTTPTAQARRPAATSASQPRRLGETLREARVRAGLTLQDVASPAGISVSALSKIENGQVEAKFATLMRLSAALSLSMADLAAPSPTRRVPGARVVTRQGQGVPHANAQYEYGFLCGDLAAKSMLPSLITVKARSLEDFPEWNRHGGEEFVLVLRGRVRLHMEGYEPVLLETGDSVYYDSSIGHALVGVGRHPVQVLSVASDRGREAYGAPAHERGGGRNA